MYDEVVDAQARAHREDNRFLQASTTANRHLLGPSSSSAAVRPPAGSTGSTSSSGSTGSSQLDRTLAQLSASPAVLSWLRQARAWHGEYTRGMLEIMARFGVHDEGQMVTGCIRKFHRWVHPFLSCFSLLCLSLLAALPEC